MKALFLQTAHPLTDDRIVHQINTLKKEGIVCSYATRRQKDDYADVIICDTPKAVLRNIGHRGRVVYDVTEWYPSKKNLRPYSPVLRPIIAVAMAGLSVIAGLVTDRFIFGEKDKGGPFRILFWWKKYCYLPYYPSKRLFDSVSETATAQSGVLKVLYAGPLTEEKGYDRAVRVAQTAGVELTVLGPDQYMPLSDFCQYVRHFDVALDLRKRDVENRRCLPIKLFYYWAAGVVPIYSDLDAIRKHIPDVEDFAFLVKNEQEAIAVLNRLQQDKTLLQQYCNHGRKAFAERFHWESVEERLINIIK